MITQLLRAEVQEFIQQHRHQPLDSLALSKSPFSEIPMYVLVEQIEGWQKAKEKLPQWNETNGILFPKRVSMEQCSSELSANYKTSIVKGNSLMDMTGGFGVDVAVFAKKIPKTTYCEQNQSLKTIAQHNFNLFNLNNIHCLSCNALSYLYENPSLMFDWIYVDPSRRDEKGDRVHALKDCSPDLTAALPLLFNHTQNILVKLSPMLDISQVINELQHVREVHVVAINNEVHEVLYVLQQGFSKEADIHAVNLNQEGCFDFKFTFSEEKNQPLILQTPQQFLYEPNAAILKSGAFKSVCTYFNVNKLHKNSHLYTSENFISHFPGRSFKIEKVVIYGKQTQQEISSIYKANIAVRNFPQSVENLRNRLKIKEGGENYLFFTTLSNEKKAVLFCQKINS